jgi:hypothetical protein
MVKVMDPGRKPGESNESEVITKIREFLSYKVQIDKLTKSQAPIKAEVMEAIEAHGEEDDKGNYVFELPITIDGYSKMVRQRRVTRKLDMDEALSVLKQRGLYDSCVTMVPMVNEDAVMSALYEGKISEEEIDAMWPQNVIWALLPTKE